MINGEDKVPVVYTRNDVTNKETEPTLSIIATEVKEEHMYICMQSFQQ